MEERVHQSLFSTRTPEKPEKKLQRIMWNIVNMLVSSTHQ